MKLIHYKSGKLRQSSVATLQSIFGWRSVKVLPPWATKISGRLIPAPGAALLNVHARSSELRCLSQGVKTTCFQARMRLRAQRPKSNARLRALCKPGTKGFPRVGEKKSGGNDSPRSRD